MLNRSTEEAAFLTNSGDAPRVGERLELAEADRSGLTGSGSATGGGPHLPKFGRVIRLDDPQGTTRRVAIRFEPLPRSSLIGAPG